MRYLIYTLILLSAFLFTASSCNTDNNEYAGEIFIEINPSIEYYFWGDEVTVTVTMEDEDLVDVVTISINGEIMIEDHLSPYSYTWNTSELSYGEHEVSAAAEYRDNSSTTLTQTFQLIPCPLYETDLAPFENISETDEMGNYIGSVDEDDWLESEGNLLGPAYPNPTSSVSYIKLVLTEQMLVTVIILNQDNEILEVILDNDDLTAGNHFVYWDVPANVNNIYRSVIHTSTGLHCHGDILVQPE